MRETGASLPAVVRAAVTRDCEPSVAALLNKIDRERIAIRIQKLKEISQNAETTTSKNENEGDQCKDIEDIKQSDSDEATGSEGNYSKISLVNYFKIVINVIILFQMTMNLKFCLLILVKKLL